MAFLDIVLGTLLAWGLYKGLRNGLFVEIASVTAAIAGIFGSIRFSYITSDYLSKNMDWDGRSIKIAAFLITFIAIVLIVHLLSKFLTKIANFAMLGLLNRIAGAIFGTLKIAIILGAVLIFFETVTTSFNFVNEETKNESIFYDPIKEIGEFVFGFVLKQDSLAQDG
ncbi:MAG: CvpA family protein [Bacteroidota bacterium]